MKRIVSLIPSGTEIVCALGFEDQLVGRSHECDYPFSVKNLPICTEPKIKLEGTSMEIDKNIKVLLENALSVYRVYENKLKELQPDIIITQDQCEVCAINLEDVEKAAHKVLESHPKIVSLAPNTLDEIWNSIEKVAKTLNVHKKGRQVVSQLKQRVDTIYNKTHPLTNRPTVTCIEWIDPLMAAGNWVPELVTFAGGNNIFGEKGKHSPLMKWNDIIEKNPDVIIVMPCGFDIKKTLEEMSVLIEKPGWADLRAVKNNRVYVTDGNQYFNRPGPRLVESLEILAEILHSDIFHFGHEGKGWQYLIP